MPFISEVERSLKTTAAACESSPTFGTGWCGSISATFWITENNDGGRVVSWRVVWRWRRDDELWGLGSPHFFWVWNGVFFSSGEIGEKRGSLGEWTGKRRMFAIELLQLGYNYIHSWCIDNNAEYIEVEDWFISFQSVTMGNQEQETVGKRNMYVTNVGRGSTCLPKSNMEPPSNWENWWTVGPTCWIIPIRTWLISMVNKSP